MAKKPDFFYSGHLNWATNATNHAFVLAMPTVTQSVGIAALAHSKGLCPVVAYGIHLYVLYEL